MASWGPTAVLLVVLPLVPVPGLGGAVADDSDWVKLPSKCEGSTSGFCNIYPYEMYRLHYNGERGTVSFLPVNCKESELGILDLMQVFVEVLDKCFENVCELDLIFHVDKVHNILAEMVMGGMDLGTNMNETVTQIDAQNKLEKSEAGLVGAPAWAVSVVKNMNLPEIPGNINIGNITIKCQIFPLLSKLCTPVCKIVALELKSSFEETGKTKEVIDTKYGFLDGRGSQIKYTKSDIRLIDVQENICNRLLTYNLHKERTGSNRFAKEKQNDICGMNSSVCFKMCVEVELRGLES
ncbi:UNVERIFIED_CONTAM: hypothetical protein K2H54_043322 [Gekko kuhli]